MNTATRQRDLSIRNMVYKTVRNTIKEHNMLDNVGHVVLGLSGGPDSMCLLNVLLELSKESGFEIHPVHINHLIRPGACDEDQRFCEEYSASNGLRCRSFVFDCNALAKEKGITTEEAGRDFRYESFAKVVEEIKTGDPEGEVVVAVAQNADDQVETVLMRILRGTGTDGLRGISYVRDDSRGFKIIRPLLDVTKKEVLEYLNENNIKYCVDETNKEDIYHRNKIRLNLIPYLEESFNPKAGEAIRRLAIAASEDVDYLEKCANIAFERIVIIDSEKRGETVILDNSAFKELEPAIARRVLSLALKEVGLREDVGSDHYKNAMDVSFAESPSGETHLPKGYIVRRQYDKLYIEKINAGEDAESKSASPAETSEGIWEIQVLPFEEFSKSMEPELKSGNQKYAAFDLDLLRESFGEDVLERIVTRPRAPGDTIRLKMGTKKLQDLMVDDKIPKNQRDSAMVTAIGNQVLWFVPPEGGKMRWTSQFSLSNQTKTVVLIRLNY